MLHMFFSISSEKGYIHSQILSKCCIPKTNSNDHHDIGFKLTYKHISGQKMPTINEKC